MVVRTEMACILMFAQVWLAACAAIPSQPHILFVVADDLGWDDVGFRSREIKTPTIDLLAKEGIVLDQYYVQDVCSPSRATFMTGRFAMHHSIVDWIPPAAAYGLPLNETTIAEKMVEAGYEAHAVGKWHLGFFQHAYTPTYRGFSSFFGYYGGGENYYRHTNQNIYDLRRDPQPKCGPNCSQVAWQEQGMYSTTIFTTEAIKVIDNHNTSKPLFLYLAYQAVHSPAQVPSSYVDPYTETIPDQKRRTFAGMLSCMDEGIGNVTAALKARGMTDNLLIIFTTDNGGPTTTGDSAGSRNWPLRGGKHSIWEGGTRGVALVHGPMLKQSGYTFTQLMHGADWFPTLCQVAGVNPAGRRNLALDGVTQWDALNVGNTFAPPMRTGFVYGNSTNNCSPTGIPCGFGLRQDNWKLIQGWGGGPDTWCNSTSSTPSCANYSSSSSSSSPSSSRTFASCFTFANLCFPGNDITHAQTNTSDACCALCQATTACAGWTYQPTQSTCYVKSKLEGQGNPGSCTSGTDTPVPPSPAPTPKEYVLFDVVADPTERREVSSEHPDVVAALGAVMGQVLESYTQFQPDHSCPPVIHPNDTHVGLIWTPWCDGH